MAHHGVRAPPAAAGRAPELKAEPPTDRLSVERATRGGLRGALKEAARQPQRAQAVRRGECGVALAVTVSQLSSRAAVARRVTDLLLQECGLALQGGFFPV